MNERERYNLFTSLQRLMDEYVDITEISMKGNVIKVCGGGNFCSLSITVEIGEVNND